MRSLLVSFCFARGKEVKRQKTVVYWCAFVSLKGDSHVFDGYILHIDPTCYATFWINCAYYRVIFI